MLKQQTFLKDLEGLVSLETLSTDTVTNKNILKLIEDWIDTKAHLKILENEGYSLLIAGNKDTKKPDICYLVHADVVSGRPDQFKMKVEGDKLIGRGVSDMKYSIPIGVSLLNDIITSKKKISFSFVVTTDEETGGFKGGKFLADIYGLNPKVLIVPDGGNNFKFINRSKGVCQILIKSVGKPAHASMIWNGKNALDPLTKIASRLLEKYGETNTKENWKTTMNIGQIQGGISVNQVCPEAIMKLDFRYPETDSIERIMNEVRSLAKEIEPNLSIENLSTGLPTFTDPNLPVVRQFLSSMKSVLDKDTQIVGEPGASDARHFAPYNIPILMTKPDGGDIHGENEWVSLSSIFKLNEILVDFVDRLSKT